jgi:tRNA 2-thiouridine synthesizing protein A
MTAAIKPNVTLDLSGLTCPAPLLGAKRVLDDLRTGEVLCLISDCPGTRDDLFLWAKRTDHEILSAEKNAGGKNQFLIRKGKRPPAVANITLDIRGVACPGPVIEAKKILSGMQAGNIMKLVSSCPASREEVSTWTATTSHYKLLDTQEVEPGIWEFLIEKH